MAEFREDNRPGTAGTGAAGNAVSDVVDSTKQAAGQMISQVRQNASARIDEHKQTAATGLASIAEAVRQAGQGLKGQEQGPLPQFAAEYGNALAGQVERLSGYLREHSVNELVADVETFARRQPAYFLAGAFLLGVASTRFLKSSRPAPRFLADLPNPNRALPPAGFPFDSPIEPAATAVTIPRPSIG